MDVLAAAYARAGRFDEAVSAGTAATTLAASTPDQAAGIRDRVAMYRRHVAYVDGAR
jgi:hypothetical protein